MQSRTPASVAVLVALMTVAAGPPDLARSTGPDCLTVAVAGWLAWVVAALVVTSVGLAVAARGRGPVSLICRRMLATYPAPVRRWAVTVAAGTAVTAMGAAPAVAATAGVVAAGRGHGVTAQPVAVPLDWPSLEQRDPPSSGATHRPDQHVSAVVVRAGDCLWSIAQRPLGPAATPAAVASSWPRWWSANRDVIGPDPGLLHPGQLLRAPVRTDGRTTR